MTISHALSLTALVAAFTLPLSAQAATIENPTDEQVISLYHFLAGDPPNFEDEVRNDYEYTSANEFDKPAVLKQLMAQKRALYEANADVDLIRIRTNSSFGEFNADLGSYQFKIFEPGVYFPFGPGFHSYGLTMENAADFRDWKLPVADAKEMRTAAPHGGLTFEVAIRPFGVVATRDKHIRGQIVDVKAYLRNSTRLVYEAAVSPSEYRAIVGADTPEEERALAPEKVAIQGVTPGMARADFEAWLSKQGYLSNPGQRQISFGTNNESIKLHYSDGNLKAVGNIDYDPVSAGVFGKDFDCRTVDDRLHSCGYARFDEAGKLRSMMLMQSAVGVTKQQIVSSLNKAYGSPSDRFNVFVRQSFRGEQFVWGLSSIELQRNTSDLSDMSGSKHWQVEAAISEPSTKRIVIFVQVNQIDTPATDGAVSGGGQIKF
ncbi:MAG: hypothetical protein ABJO27_09965 [Pseudoruegeria sp.]